MARRKRSILGIDIGPDAIRIVEMRGPTLLRVGAVPLPPQAFDGDRIKQPEALAHLVRGLMHRMGCQSRSAVVGIGGQSIVTRTLTVPRVPDAELRTVVEGELAHYQIFRPGTGAFDFFRLEAAPSGETGLSVLLMATEERVTRSYRTMAEKAGLELLALEPITLSLYRAGAGLLDLEAATLCLLITPHRTELCVCEGDAIRLYRRLDLGLQKLSGEKEPEAAPRPRPSIDLSSAEALTDFTLRTRHEESLPGMRVRSETPLGDFASEARPDDANWTEPGIRATAGSILVHEVRRTLDYFGREFPQSPAPTRLIVSGNAPQAAELRDWLACELTTEVRLAEPLGGMDVPASARPHLTAPRGLAYLGAVGLAQQPMLLHRERIPSFNLTLDVRRRLAPMERDRLVARLFFAGCVLVGGLLGGHLFARLAETEGSSTHVARIVLGSKQREFSRLAQEIEKERDLQAIVRSDGLPMASLLDLLTDALPPGVTLSGVTVERDGRLSIEGDAQDAAHFNRFYLRLMQTPQWIHPQYQRLSSPTADAVLHFRIETSLRGTQGAQRTSPTAS